MESIYPYCASKDNILSKGSITQGEVRGAAGIAITSSFLSVFGSFGIIISYIFIKGIRTKAREILIHISVMDILLGLANLIGAAVNFNDRLISSDQDTSGLHIACQIDAYFATLGTVGSIIWTISLAVYLYLKVISIRVYDIPQLMRGVSIAMYIVGYALPVVVATYFLVLGFYGPSDLFSSGWCTLNMVNTKTGWSHPVPFAIGYDLWMYGALLIIPLLVFATKIIMSNKTRGFKEGTAPISPVVHLSWKSVELKLMAIPIIFLLLRMWSMIMGILFIYSKSFCSVPPTVIKALIVLAGIGDSGQGFFNFLLFVILTKSVRSYFCYKMLKCCPCAKKGKIGLLLADSQHHKKPLGVPSSSIH